MKKIREFINKNIFCNQQCFCGSYITRVVSWCASHPENTWNWSYYTCLTCDKKFTLKKEQIKND